VINTAAKFQFGVAVVALVLAVGYGFAESGDPSGFVLLMGVFVAAGLAGLALTLSGVKDWAAVYGADAPPLETVAAGHSQPAAPSLHPFYGALAAGLFAVGLATGHVLVYLGVIAAMLAAAVWLALDWREDPSWTRRLEERVVDRLVTPFALPALAVALVGIIVISISRVLLAVSKHASVVVAFVLALGLLVAFFVIASRPRMGRAVIAGLSAVALIAVLSAGGVGAAQGERRFEQHVPPPPTLVVVAQNIRFSTSQLTVPAGQAVVVHFSNRDPKTVYHDIAVYTDTKGPVVAGEPIHGGQKITYNFQFGPGTYIFKCDFHPTMTGSLTAQG
jgi:plastocyanin